MQRLHGKEKAKERAKAKAKERTKEENGKNNNNGGWNDWASWNQGWYQWGNSGKNGGGKRDPSKSPGPVKKIWCTKFIQGKCERDKCWYNHWTEEQVNKYKAKAGGKGADPKAKPKAKAKGKAKSGPAFAGEQEEQPLREVNSLEVAAVARPLIDDEGYMRYQSRRKDRSQSLRALRQ